MRHPNSCLGWGNPGLLTLKLHSDHQVIFIGGVPFSVFPALPLCLSLSLKKNGVAVLYGFVPELQHIWLLL